MSISTNISISILSSAKWITDYNKNNSPIFRKKFFVNKSVRSAVLYVSALGAYEANLNGSRVGDFILAPGWTNYKKRIQYQEYDIAGMLELGKENEIRISVGKAWCAGEIGRDNGKFTWTDTVAIIAALKIKYDDGGEEIIFSDQTWESSLLSPIIDSELFQGEIYDARIVPGDWDYADEFAYSRDVLIPQEGELMKEIEELAPIDLIITPLGEWVLDFGQNLVGYARFTVRGAEGEKVVISHAEVLDSAGNFYTENLRSAKQQITYICKGEYFGETFKPHFTFQGFRYIRIDEHPEILKDALKDAACKKFDAKFDEIKNKLLENFRAIVVHSDMKRTGYFECSNPLVNKLFENVIWGQKGNFLDVPTDCPQRNERLGWTGDAQVFVRTASLNFDVNKFFTKWLHDLASEQLADGRVPYVIPQMKPDYKSASAAWADAATICPWQIYLTYNNIELLEEQYPSMLAWVEYMHKSGGSEFLWDTGDHFGDWLGLDSEPGSYRGATDDFLIASAFFAYSTSLLIKAAEALGRDTTHPEEYNNYKNLYPKVVNAFQDRFMSDGKLTSNTQTAHVLALYFNLCKGEFRQQNIDSLVELIKNNNNKISTGFVGTPYILHVLADNGHRELAYSLLLEEDFPSWLYPVRMGATTIWEHWDGIKPDGSMWSPDMNSFNHYAYGAVADFLYGVVAGINIDEHQPGFKHIIFWPIPDPMGRLDHATASIKTKYGTVISTWTRTTPNSNPNLETGPKTELEPNSGSCSYTYTFTVPAGCTATAILSGDPQFITNVHKLDPGTHTFTVLRKDPQ